MLPNDFGAGTLGTLGAVPGCVCTSVLTVLAFVALASAATDGLRFGPCEIPATFADGCSFEMLTFYYDDDGVLQCECPDDVDDEDWCFGWGLA